MTTDLEALARRIVAHAATQGTTRTKLAQGVLDLSARNAELERENGANRGHWCQAHTKQTRKCWHLCLKASLYAILEHLEYLGKKLLRIWS